MAQKDIVDFPRVLLVIGSGTLITIATIFAVQGLFYWGSDEDFARKNVEAPREIHALREAQSRLLTEYKKHSDPAASRYVIPIDRAIDIVANELKQPR